MSRLGILVLGLGACASQPVSSTSSKPGTDLMTVKRPGTGIIRQDLEGVQGFIASQGDLTGLVVNADGKPVANAPVQLASQHGERTVTTDEQGRFKTVIAEPTMVAVYGGLQVTGGSSTTEKINGDEAIVLHEADRPAKLAKALSDPTEVPDYTDAIRDANVWVRAWVLVEVNERGGVSRVKLLNPPGYDLDAIAVREAFKLKFEPARNRVDQPLPSLMVWKFEWPPTWWADRLPPHRWSRLPCRKHAGENWNLKGKPFRDCSQANIAAAMTTRWIAP
jgi:hypothetical protein